LPRTSPFRVGASLVYGADRRDARVDLFRVQAQSRVAENALPTDGSTMRNASAKYRLTRDRCGLVAVVTATDLLVEDARNHVSYRVTIAPMGGRGTFQRPRSVEQHRGIRAGRPLVHSRSRSSLEAAARAGCIRPRRHQAALSGRPLEWATSPRSP